uniref:Uncharacterized protein n=1 Tax=Nelumbo nucifera TaxID=4432 RepID=A0A822Z5F3_NELNU|nr:TPA_asm: hypothetical protein HUJ06_008867 [Nelumbo nucifera]
MRGFNIPEFLRASFFMKVSAFALIFFALSYLARHYSDGYQQLIFFSSRQQNPVIAQTPPVALSPNANKTFGLASITPNQTLEMTNPPLPPPLLLTLTLQAVDKTGILDETRTMLEEFEVGEFDPELIKSLGNLSRQDGRGMTEMVKAAEKIRLSLRLRDLSCVRRV